MGSSNSSIVITGASGQLGRSVAATLLSRGGANLLLVSRSAVRKVSNDTDELLGNGLDLTTDDSFESLKTYTKELPGRISVINCIGYFPGYKGLLNLPNKEITKVFNVNLMSVYHTAATLMPLMVQRGGGHFITFGTLSSIEALPMMGAFNTAKAGLESLSRHLAHEFGGQKVRANTFALATLKTEEEMRLKPFGDHDHWIDPSEMAGLICDFLSGRFDLLNGNVLQCYHHSPTFYSTSYESRIRRKIE